MPKRVAKLAGPIFTSWRLGLHSSFRRNIAALRAVGNAVSDLTGPTFETRTSRSRDERVTARPQVRKTIVCSIS